RYGGRKISISNMSVTAGLWAEHRIDQRAGFGRSEKRIRHQATEEDRAEQRLCRKLGSAIDGEIAAGDGGCNKGDRRPARLRLKLEMKATQRRVALRGIDHRRQAG